MSQQPIYLDYNATTPIRRDVAHAMAPYLYDHFGNPSSSHAYGAQTRQAVERARGQVAALLGCHSDEVIFTSGGSEANNNAIKGVAEAHKTRGNHLVTSAVEHPAVREPCAYLAARGFRVTVVPVDEYGRVDPADVARAMTPGTLLVSIMHANNEVGTLQPIAEIAEIAHAGGALLHVDAAQSVGKVPVDVGELGADLLSVAGHKFYAPKGIGALYVRRGVTLARLVHGADHEFGRRAGTENVLEIVGLGEAAALAAGGLESDGEHLRAMRDRLYGALRAVFAPEVMRLNGHPDDRLPNTLSVSFRGVEANTLLSEIGDRVAASAGAACHAEEITVSPVLEAMGVPVEYAMGTVRLTVGMPTTEDEIDAAVAVIIPAVRRLLPGGEAAPLVVGDGASVRLTQYTHGLGCACKLRPQALERVLGAVPPAFRAPEVMIGGETADDAAVYRLNGQALVQTVDFFTPIVDDPYDFGAIAAANALSDIYAMGARPLFALNVVGFPSNRLPLGVLEQILRGAQDKAAEAEVSVIGGHTVDDTEPKFGMAVTGVVAPEGVITNAGAGPGDALVLTKPLGLGVITTALKRGLLDEATLREATALMAALNRGAAEAMVAAGASACTDVTGFGLLGHLREMAAGAGLDAELWARAVPVLDVAWELAAGGVISGGTQNNLSYVAPYVEWADAIGEIERLLLADAQTSGGLLIAIAPDRLDDLLARLAAAEVPVAAHIGRFQAAGTGRIRVLSAEN